MSPSLYVILFMTHYTSVAPAAMSQRISCLRRVILQASIGHFAVSFRLAALVIEEDTIPKPHGLGDQKHSLCNEQKSTELGPRSRKIDECSDGVYNKHHELTTHLNT